MGDTIVIETPVATVLEVSGLQGPQGPTGPQGPAGGGGGGGSGTVTSVALAGTGLSITGSPVTASGTITANVSYGTTAGTACEGNDSRLSNARTPTAHASSHWGGGNDPLSLEDLTVQQIQNGSIYTWNDGQPHGSINTGWGNSNIYGGSINTSEGGGSIDTRGTGSIEFGSVGTRTTLAGTATADRDISLPDSDGTLIVQGGNSITTYDGDITIGDLGGYGGISGFGRTIDFEQNAISGFNIASSGPISVSGLTQATNRILGRTTAGTGAVEELTATQVRTLINVADGATANASDATLLARANHTGTQGISTITQNTNRILGRTTASTGAVEEITVSGGASLSAGALTVHAQSHAITSTSDHTATANRVFYSNSSGQVTELALGAANTVLTSNGTTSAPTFSALPSGGSKTYFRATALDNQPPSSSFATLDTRNSIAVLDFDDASTESAIFVGVMPEGASLGSGLIVYLHFMATTATSGNVRWSVAFERSNTDLDADSFDTATAATVATNGTSGIVTVGSITCTTIDSVTAGDLFRLRVQRLGADAADSMTGDAELVAVEVRSAA